MRPNTEATVSAWARLLQPKYVFAVIAAAASFLLAQTDVMVPPAGKVILGLLLVIVALTDPNGPPEDHRLVDDADDTEPVSSTELEITTPAEPTPTPPTS